MPTPDRDTGLPEFVGWVWTHLFAAGSGRISVRMMDRATLSPEEANQLWEAYRSGSNPTAMRAIDALYRALRPVLIEFCKSKGCDAELADEITEQAFFRLMHRKPPVEPRRSAGIEDTTPQKEFPAQNIFIDNELSDGRREARTWALASERRSRYALKEITSKAARAMSGCGLPGNELPFCQAARSPASRTVWLARLGSDSEL